MKILEIIPNLSSGGAQRFVVDLSNEFVTRNNLDIVIITMYDRTDGDIFFNDINDKIRYISLGKQKGFDFKMIYKLWMVIRRENPDIVHSHLGAFPYLFLLMFLCKCKFYHTVHNDAYKESIGIVRTLRKIAFKTKRCVPITISEESQRSFANLYRLPSFLIYNGCCPPNDAIFSLKRFRFTEDTRIFVNVARIFKQKNQVILGKLFNRLISEENDIVLLIIGRIEDKKMYEQLQFFLSDRILYIGEVDNPRAYLKEADFFCLPSTHEGMPISLFEALSVGCIPVCTPVGGCINVIEHGINGLLAKSYKEEDIYSILCEAISLGKNNIQEMKLNAQKTFLDYSILTSAKKYVTLFERTN